MKKEEAIRLQANGDLVNIEAVPALLKHGWNLQLRFKDGHTELLQDVHGKEKWFGRPDTLIRTAFEIGFLAINIHKASHALDNDQVLKRGVI
ncbi:MAG: hypothetical protein V3U84_08055 [Thiotrichaceae bacterium]